MEIRHFEKVDGSYIERFSNTTKYGYSLSDYEEFYEIPSWFENGGYQGNTLSFYDFETGKVHTPFEKKRNVAYSNYPIFYKEHFYFLKADFNENTVEIIKYFPEICLESIFKTKIDSVDTYNLRLIETGINLISQDSETFKVYYPIKLEGKLNSNESLIAIDQDRLYINAWIEEGIDENDRITDKYNYYNKLIIKDFDGNIISEEIGDLAQDINGNWWIS